MKCRFEHEEDCCNRGSPQYMCKCKPDVCHSAILMTNADCLRAMTDEELEDQLVMKMEGAAPCKMFVAIPTGEMFLYRDAAREAVGKWLREPAEEE